MLYLKKVARLEPPACLVIEDAVSGAAAAMGAGSRCLGLTNSFTAPQLTAFGADWTAPDRAPGP